MKNFLLVALFVLTMTSIYANNLHTVTNPTAGVLSRGEARIHNKVFLNNGLQLGATVGLFDNFQFGVTYGGEHLVGNQEPKWYDIPSFNARLRVINETLTFPAIAIGFDNLGHGAYYKGLNRYDIKSKGAYVVASKNFSFLGLIGFDFGMNYSFENTEEGRFDFFAGVYKTVGQNLTLFTDFSAGLNDNQTRSGMFDGSRGFLNTGVQLRLNDQLSIKLLMHDLFENKYNTHGFDRSILIDYRWFF